MSDSVDKSINELIMLHKKTNILLEKVCVLLERTAIACELDNDDGDGTAVVSMKVTKRDGPHIQQVEIRGS